MHLESYSARLLSTRQVASLLNLSTRAVRRWIERGSLPALRIGGSGPYRIRIEDLYDFLGSDRWPAE